MGDLGDVSKCHQEDVQERRRSGAEEFDVLSYVTNRLLHLLIIRSMSGSSPVHSAISVLRTRSYHWIQTICLWHFTWKDSKLMVSEASRVHVLDAKFADSDRRLSVHTLLRKDMTELIN